MTDKLTFDQLPALVLTLTEEVRDFKNQIQELTRKVELKPEAEEKPILIDAAAALLDLAVPTVYSKVSRGELPCFKRGKRLYFYRKDLLEYFNAGRKKMPADFESKIDQFISKPKKG